MARREGGVSTKLLLSVDKGVLRLETAIPPTTKMTEETTPYTTSDKTTILPESKSHKTRYVAFDIETAPLDDAKLEAIRPPFDPSEVKVGNLKDEAKIAEKIASAQASHAADFRGKAALHPLTSRIAAIGYSSWNAGEVVEAASVPVLQTAETDEEERLLLEVFFSQWEKSATGQRTIFVGHNITDFDLPFIVNRARVLRARIPTDLFKFKNGRTHYSDRFADTRAIFAAGRDVRELKTSLDFIAKAMGLGGKDSLPEGAVKDFGNFLKTNRDEALRYLSKDVTLTAAIAIALDIDGIFSAGEVSL